MAQAAVFDFESIRKRLAQRRGEATTGRLYVESGTLQIRGRNPKTLWTDVNHVDKPLPVPNVIDPVSDALARINRQKLKAEQHSRAELKRIHQITFTIHPTNCLCSVCCTHIKYPGK